MPERPSPPSRSPRRIYLARHAACEAGDVLLGQYDAALSPEGRKQAAILVEELQGCGIERIVSSPLRRALETAEPIASSLGLVVERDERLKEISYGVWDGRRWAEIECADAATARRKLDDWWGVTPPGGERFSDFYGRVERAWQSLLRHPAGASVVVSHQAVDAVLVDLSRRWLLRDRADAGPDRQSIMSFRQEPADYEVVTLPGTAPLDE